MNFSFVIPFWCPVKNLRQLNILMASPFLTLTYMFTAEKFRMCCFFDHFSWLLLSNEFSGMTKTQKFVVHLFIYDFSPTFTLPGVVILGKYHFHTIFHNYVRTLK
jgi:hypothetical protein